MRVRGDAWKCVAAENRSREQGVTMTTLWVAIIGHCHTANQWNLEIPILTKGRAGKGAKQTNKHKAMLDWPQPKSPNAPAKLQRAPKNHKWEAAGQHCLEFNIALTSFSHINRKYVTCFIAGWCWVTWSGDLCPSEHWRLCRTILCEVCDRIHHHHGSWCNHCCYFVLWLLWSYQGKQMPPWNGM